MIRVYSALRKWRSTRSIDNPSTSSPRAYQSMSDCHRADGRGIVKDGWTVPSQIVRDLRAATEYEIIVVLNGEEALVATSGMNPILNLPSLAIISIAPRS